MGELDDVQGEACTLVVGDYLDIERVMLGPAGPAISSIFVARGPNGTAVITWNADMPSSSSVSYGTSPDLLKLQVNDSNLTAAHLLNLSGLPRDTTYQCCGRRG